MVQSARHPAVPHKELAIAIFENARLTGQMYPDFRAAEQHARRMLAGEALLAAARATLVAWTGPDGVLSGLTPMERAAAERMVEAIRLADSGPRIDI